MQTTKQNQTIEASHPYQRPSNGRFYNQSKTISARQQTQTFLIIYNNSRFMVDPHLLIKSSLKFKKMIDPFIEDNHIPKNIFLRINDHEFTNKSMKNFLKLCQQLPAEIKDSEIKEICKIAEIFQAEKIYQKYANKNLVISSNKSDKFMFIESYVIDDFEKDNNFNSILKETNLTNELYNKPINYQVKISYQFMKCPIFQFSNEEKILFSAKKQTNCFFVGEGDEVHIKKDTSNHVAKIVQDQNRTNFIFANKKRFQLKYSGKQNNFSISVTFPHQNKTITWNSKKSKKNCVFEDSLGHTVLSVKKISYQKFEFESFQSIDPLMIFIIGLSGIIGPHDEPFGGF